MKRSTQKYYTITILGLIFIATFAIGLWARSQADRWPTGDEPNYATMAQQFVKHGNFELKQAFEEKQYLGVFYGSEIEPQINWAYFSRTSPEWYSIHSVGEALLVAPAVLLARTANSSELFFSIILMSLLGAVTAAALWRLCYELTQSKSGSTIATLVFVLSTSFLSLTGTMFPDLPTALLLILSVFLLNRLRESPSTKLYVLTSLTAVLLVIFHAKNTLISITIIGLLFASLISNKARLRRIAFVMLPAAILGGLYLLKIHDWYGAWIITQPFSNGQLFVLPPAWSIVASLFDTTKGLLFNNPAMFFIFAGIPIWYKRDKSSLYMVLLLIVPSMLVQSTFNDWAGGYSPIGRYILAYLVILLPTIAYLWEVLRHKVIAQTVVLVAIFVQGVVALTYIARGYMWNYAGEQNPLLANMQSHFRLAQDISSPIFSYAAAITSPTRGLVLSLEIIAVIGLFAWGISLAKVSDS